MHRPRGLWACRYFLCHHPEAPGTVVWFVGAEGVLTQAPRWACEQGNWAAACALLCVFSFPCTFKWESSRRAHFILLGEKCRKIISQSQPLLPKPAVMVCRVPGHRLCWDWVGEWIPASSRWWAGLAGWGTAGDATQFAGSWEVRRADSSQGGQRTCAACPGGGVLDPPGGWF